MATSRSVAAPPSLGGKKTDKAQGPSHYFPVATSGWNGKISKDWWASRDGGARKHKGNDIFAAEGTPVVAVTNGVISIAGDDGGKGGLRVWLRGDDGRKYYFAHLSAIDVKPGQRVTAGAVLGAVGKTGNAKNTPAHLHFAVRELRNAKTGKPDPKGVWTDVNPATWYGTTNVLKTGLTDAGRSTETNWAAFQKKYGKDAISYINNYKSQLDSIGYKGPRDQETLAYAMLNDVTAQDFASGDYATLQSTANAGFKQDEARHNFESQITSQYRDMLGVAPSKETLAYHTNKYDAGPYNINDVSEFIRNSNQFKQRMETQIAPAIIGKYQELLGITDIKAVPATYNYVLNKFKSGEWTDLSQVESFIMASPGFEKRRDDILTNEISTEMARLTGGTLTDTSKRYFVNRYKAGDTVDMIESYIRATPEFQKRYPGIREDMSVTDWDSMVNTLNRLSQDKRGKAFDPWNDADDLNRIKGGSINGN